MTVSNSGAYPIYTRGTGWTKMPSDPYYPPPVIRDNLALMLPQVRRERLLREMHASDETMGWRR